VPLERRKTLKAGVFADLNSKQPKSTSRSGVEEMYI